TEGRQSDLPTPTRSGSYSFDGWYTAVSGGEKVTTSTVFTENSTIYAHWTRTGGGSSGGSHSGGSTSYAITVADAENGSATASRKSASKGTTITVTATPDKG
ncbi:InlB B-repeat-containing protein, partial [Intestinimonas massiliensis]|uniref:InlB B-repeat-containing protein n=1 Tax=Intestinimonas massiliensis (ex Afouda et al. 2020) TaxID=1673721 RepID=UPI00210E50E0